MPRSAWPTRRPSTSSSRSTACPPTVEFPRSLVTPGTSTVDGDYVELDGKWTNYSPWRLRPDRRHVPASSRPGPAALPRPGELHARRARSRHDVRRGRHRPSNIRRRRRHDHDPRAGRALINAKKGSKIAPGSSDFTSGAGGTIVASPSAFLSVNNTCTAGRTHSSQDLHRQIVRSTVERKGGNKMREDTDRRRP